MSTQVQLLVGTKKGAFLYTSDEKRDQWEVSQPIMPGWGIFHMAADLRADPPRLYAAGKHAVWGPCVAKKRGRGQDMGIAQ